MNESTTNFDDFQLTTLNEDDNAYIIPIKIILPITHIHKISENDSFVQYDYILLQTNDTSYHAHFNNDKPVILFPENKTKSSPTFTSNEQKLNVLPLNITVTTEDTIAVGNGTIYSTSTISGESIINVTNSNNNNNISLSRNNSSNDNSSNISGRISINASESNEQPILVDSDGYRYQRIKQYKIFNDVGEVAVEFEDIVPARTITETTTICEKGNIASGRNIQDSSVSTETASNSEEYDEHYGKILQWINYTL